MAKKKGKCGTESPSKGKALSSNPSMAKKKRKCGTELRTFCPTRVEHWVSEMG
jgi:hypothetical protein